MNKFQLVIELDRETAEMLYLYSKTEGEEPQNVAYEFIKIELNKIYENIQAGTRSKIHAAAPLSLN